MGNIALPMVGATGCIKRLSVEAPIDQSRTSPQVVRFVARPQVIHCGEKATLTWNVRKACVGVRLGDHPKTGHT